MRKFGIALMAGTLVMVPYAAFSQEGTTSADEFACALAGDCGEADAEEEAADPTAQPSGQPRVSATRGFSLSTTRPATSQPKASTPATTRRNRRQTASTPASQSNRPAAAQQQGRVDLRLSFVPGSAELSASDLAQVRAFAEALKRPQLADVRVRIEGHTDSSGGRALNQTLSQRRAEAVADFLKSQGIDASRLEVHGYGYDRPLPGRPASAGENRRVEAVRIS